MNRFPDRAEAGRFLAATLRDYADRNDVLVLALPRGGVPVGFEIAQQLNAPLDVFIVRKLGYPGHEEFALGAIASGGVRVLNESALKPGRVTEEQIEQVSAREMDELHRREQIYRGTHEPPEVQGKIAILVDDGLATGSTMRAAVAALRQLQPARIIVAVPVGSSEACMALQDEADEVICGAIPEPFQAVGQWYQDFAQTTDEEVQQLLEQARQKQGAHHS